MKLEVGMYVKLKTLSNKIKIGQIKEIEDKIYILDNDEVTADKFIIGEPSFDIIDLIEVGDYVNGVEIISIDDEWITMSNTQVPILKSIVNGMIKSIVTHEQMEQMAYKIGE